MEPNYLSLEPIHQLQDIIKVPTFCFFTTLVVVNTSFLVIIRLVLDRKITFISLSTRERFLIKSKTDFQQHVAGNKMLLFNEELVKN